MRKSLMMPVAAALAALPLTAANAATVGGDTTLAAAPVEDHDDDFPWGLLGLLGLAGLAGLKRRDDDRVRNRH